MTAQHERAPGADPTGDIDPDGLGDVRVDGRRTAAAARRRAREAQILAATRALFDERGVRDAQIEDIARAVGTNRAIIYRHFSGKEELFALTVVGYLDELKARMEDAWVEDAAPMDRLTGLVEAFADFGMEYPAFVDCAQTLMRRPGPELLAEISESALFRLGRGISGCLALVKRALDDGVASGDFHVQDTDMLANHLYASGLGALALARVGLVITEAAPGIPSVAPLSPDQVKGYLMESCRALAVSKI